MRKAIVAAAGLSLLATSAWSQGMSRDRDDYYRSDRRDDQRDWSQSEGSRDRGGTSDRGGMGDRGSMSMGLGMRGQGRSGAGDEQGERGSAARFFLRSGDSRLAVRCDDRETMRSCVDSALTMFDRVRAQSQQSGTASGSTSGSTSPSPGTSSTPAPASPAR